MDVSPRRAATLVAVLLVATVGSQALYTLLYLLAPEIPRKAIWGVEALLFLGIAAFAASPMVHAKALTVGWGAIFASAILNVVQVGVGLTMFGPFREAAQGSEALAPAAGAVVAYSFFVYNAAKVLLGFAALVFGLAHMMTGAGFAKALGGLTAFVGGLALVCNALVMAFGRMEGVPSGATGVIATLLLAFCVTSAFKPED